MKWNQLLAATLIPLGNPSGWQDLKFNKIPPNQIQFHAEGLTIQVKKSASPLVLPLKAVTKVKSFRVELDIDGDLKPSAGFPEDAYFRMGLVIPGQRKMGSMGKMFAPAWVTKLFELAPKDSGIDKILFFVLAGSPEFKGKSRTLPGSKDLIVEEVIADRPNGQKTIVFAHTLPQALPAAALWLSTDGDNTASEYKVTVRKIEIAD